MTQTSENKLLEELEALRIDVTAECQYDDNGNIIGEDIFEDAEAFEVIKQFMDVPKNFGSYEVNDTLNEKPI